MVVTLMQARRAIFSRGHFGRHTVLTTTSAAATNNDLNCSRLADSSLDSDAYTGVWVYIVDGALAGEQTRVSQAGLTVSTGVLRLTNTFPTAIQSGINFEMSWEMPARESLGVEGIREAINAALQSMYFVDRISIAGVTGQERYTLSTAWPWLRSKDQILRIETPIQAGQQNPGYYSGSWDIERDGEATVLKIGEIANTGQAFSLEVVRPANSRIRKGGSWVDSTDPLSGLVNDTDAAAVDIHDLTAVALGYAFEIRSRMGDPNDYYAKLAERHKVAAAMNKRFFPDSPRVTEPRSHDRRAALVGVPR